MAVTPDQEIAFDEDDPTPAEVAMWERAEAGSGWVNFLPEVEPGHHPPPRKVVAAVFSARGEAVPMATWAAPTATSHHRATLGIEHGSGPKALDRLAAHDLALPAGWVKVADHPRRGLVVATAPDTTVDDALWWLLSATHVLSIVPLTGSWLAKVYEGA